MLFLYTNILYKHQYYITVKNSNQVIYAVNRKLLRTINI